MGVSQTFVGGIHPHELGNGKQVTGANAIVDMKAPAKVTIPLSQHVGAPAECLVKVGDTVNLGQMIASAKGAISAPVHASVSGKVVAVGPVTIANGRSVTAVTIENDFEDRWDDSVKPVEHPDAESIARLAAEKGIVGMGGAAFPTAVKLEVSQLNPRPDVLVINGSECEPYLTSDHRLMLEAPEQIIDGVLLAMKATGIAKAKIGVEDNKMDAVEALRAAAKEGVEVVALPAKYPQGYEKMLIYALTGRKVPNGGLPSAAQCVVMNVATCAALSAAVRSGRPLVDRIVTVTGHVGKPGNYRVRIGTPLMDLLDAAGGLDADVRKVIVGGPMMGNSIPSLAIPVTKNFGGLLALAEEGIAPEESACIRCGRCVRACPMGLMPTQMDAYIRHDDIENAVRIGVLNCMECGSCTYVCPAKRELTQSFRMAKAMNRMKNSK